MDEKRSGKAEKKAVEIREKPFLFELICSCAFLDQCQNAMDGIHLVSLCHGIYIGLAVRIQPADGGEEFFVGDFLFLEDHAVALALKGTGIQDLVAAARVGRQRDQKVRFVERVDFADRVGACPGDHDVGEGKKVGKFLFDVFKLNIALGVFQAFIGFSFAAEMDHLEFFQKFRKDTADMLVDRSCAEASADDHEDRLLAGKAAETAASLPVALKELLPDRSSGEDGFILGKAVDRLREIAADFCCGGEAKPVGKTRGHVGFVDNGRNFAFFCRNHNRNGDETAFGKYDVRLELFQDLLRLAKTFQDPERVGEVFEVKVAAQFAGRNSVVGNAELLDEFALDPFVGTDVGDLVACLPEGREQGDIWGNMTGSAAAGKDNMFHRDSS